MYIVKSRPLRDLHTEGQMPKVKVQRDQISDITDLYHGLCGPDNASTAY